MSKYIIIRKNGCVEKYSESPLKLPNGDIEIQTGRRTSERCSLIGSGIRGAWLKANGDRNFLPVVFGWNILG